MTDKTTRAALRVVDQRSFGIGLRKKASVKMHVRVTVELAYVLEGPSKKNGIISEAKISCLCYVGVLWDY